MIRAVSRPTIGLLLLVQAGLLAMAPGCLLGRKRIDLPSTDQFNRDQLQIHSDFRLPRRHRLLDELTARREDISNKLLLPTSDEPINVYVFDDAERFQAYMRQNHPDFPDRRAFFVKDDTTLRVFAHWGERVGEDLRHEVTHGYLHSVVPALPLWLDEGLAEYFEIPRGQDGIHRQHIFSLASKSRKGKWRPDLERLEQLEVPSEMTQLDYAEAWLWVHYLLDSSLENRELVQEQLARLRINGQADPLSEQISEGDTAAAAEKILDHLAELAESL